MIAGLKGFVTGKKYITILNIVKCTIYLFAFPKDHELHGGVRDSASDPNTPKCSENGCRNK